MVPPLLDSASSHVGCQHSEVLPRPPGSRQDDRRRNRGNDHHQRRYPIPYPGATILKKLEVEHPTANLLVQLAQLQDA